ncbi:MAG: ribosome biogenesis GTPase YlqF [Bacilli bacterium]|nr:ribosome biogenesis GTPase YlqF [Bacilli bacterium]
MASQIHWFPGHMKKALVEIEEKIKTVDIVIELLDARCPFSSINDDLEKRIQNKKKIGIISKSDLADSKRTLFWQEELRKSFDDILTVDLTRNNAGDIISKSVAKLGTLKHEKDKARGMKPQPIKAMIIGVPNVGKSSLINRLAKRKAAGVQNKPGYTRGEQWIKVNNDFLLLDTPGILPMNYENRKKAANLALIGSIREEILPNSDLCETLLEYLKVTYPDALKTRFEINEISNANDVLCNIAKKRGLLSNNGEPSIEKAEAVLLKEFKDGKLGKISLE